MATIEKKLVRSKSGLRMVSSDEYDLSPLLLREPPWVPDNECHGCMGCEAKFDLMKRRHHCRRCGRCFCGSCCDNKVPLPRMSFVDPVRLCTTCMEITLKENDFFDKHLKTLIAGGSFVLTDGDEVTDNSDIVACSLAKDHKNVVVEFVQGTNETVQLREIESLQILTSGVDPMGNAVGTGLAIRYNSAVGQDTTIKLLVAQSSRKNSMAWIAALPKAMKLIYESRKTEN